MDTPSPPAGRRIFGATAPRTAPTNCYIGIYRDMYIHTYTYRVCHSGYIGLSSYCIGISVELPVMENQMQQNLENHNLWSV